MKQLNTKITTWLKYHNIDKLSPDKQYLKIIEEVGELARGLLKNDLEAIKDAIGDIYVAVMGLALQLDIQKANNASIYNMGDDYSINKIIYSVWHKEFNKHNYFDVIICLERLSYNHNLTLKECVSHAYNEIKDREIKIKNGVVVK